jgi:hypothetical protein
MPPRRSSKLSGLSRSPIDRPQGRALRFRWDRAGFRTLVQMNDAIGPRFYFLTVFWGQGFSRLFTDFCLPSLLADRNIPAIKNKAESRFIIVTTQQDWNAFVAHPIYRRLIEQIEPVFIAMEMPKASLTPGEKLLLSSAGHKAATEAAFQARAATMVVAPDVIFSNGSVASLYRRAEAGINLVFALGLRAEQDGLTRELEERGVIKPGCSLSLSPRETVALLMRHMHSELMIYEWDTDYYTNCPVSTFWRVPDGSGLVVHSLGYTPIFANYARLREHKTDVLDSGTIDGPYLHSNFGSDSEFEVIRDSDELMQLSLTREAVLTFYPLPARAWKQWPLVARAVRLTNIRGLAFNHIDPLRRKAFFQAVRVHQSEVSAAWIAVEARAAKIVDAAARPATGFQRICAALIVLVDVRTMAQLKNWFGGDLKMLSPRTYLIVLGIFQGLRRVDSRSPAVVSVLRLFLLRIWFLVLHPGRGVRRIIEHLEALRSRS